MELHWREFFDKQHLVQAAWGLIGFICGLLFQTFRGPEEVTVTNAIRPTDTLVVRVAGDSLPRGRLLLDQVVSLNRRLDRLAAEPGTSPAAMPEVGDLPNANRVAEAPLRMPPNVAGYTLNSLATLARTGCPDSSLARNQLITFSFTMLASTPLASLSPLFLRIHRMDGGSRTVVLEQQYELRSGRNVIVFAAAFPPGEYEVSYGVYRLSELSESYPSWYSCGCRVRIGA